MANQNTLSQMQGIEVNGAEVSAANPLPITTEECETIAVTIPAGQSVSSAAINLAGKQHVALMMPAAWTAANIYYTAATTEAGTYQPVVADGIEVNEPTEAGKAVSVVGNALALAPLKFIKLCSGPSTARVAQAADRIIEVQIKR